MRCGKLISVDNRGLSPGAIFGEVAKKSLLSGRCKGELSVSAKETSA